MKVLKCDFSKATALPHHLPDDVGCAPRSHVPSDLVISSFYLHQLFLHFGPVDVLSVELETGCCVIRKHKCRY